MEEQGPLCAFLGRTWVLFTAEQHGLSDQFGVRRREFLAQVRPIAQRELEAERQQASRRNGSALRRELMHSAQRIASQHLLAWLEREEQDAEQA